MNNLRDIKERFHEFTGSQQNVRRTFTSPDQPICDYKALKIFMVQTYDSPVKSGLT